MRHLTEPHGTTQFNLCRIMSSNQQIICKNKGNRSVAAPHGGECVSLRTWSGGGSPTRLSRGLHTWGACAGAAEKTKGKGGFEAAILLHGSYEANTKLRSE